MTAGGASNAHTCTILSSISLVVAGTRCPRARLLRPYNLPGALQFAPHAYANSLSITNHYRTIRKLSR